MKYQKGAYRVSCSWCYQSKGKPCRGIGRTGNAGNTSWWNIILKAPHARRIVDAQYAEDLGYIK